MYFVVVYYLPIGGGPVGIVGPETKTKMKNIYKIVSVLLFTFSIYYI